MTPRRMAVSLAVLGGFGALALSARRWPLINDITTTPEDPPRFKALAAGRPYPEAFAAVQRRAYPDLAPAAVALPPTQALALARRAAAALGWEIASETEGGFEAVATTPLLRFKDDVVVEVRKNGDGAEIHARSRSRLGRGDLGANARRLRAYRDVVLSLASR